MVLYNQKQLKQMVQSGVAVDLTHETSRDAIPEKYSQIGSSFGVNGCLNGLLLIGYSGKLYAVTARTQALTLY